MRKCKRPPTARGFTLVETMVALVILSLIMVAVLSAMRTLGQVQSRIDTVTARVDEMRQVSQFLRDTLRQAAVTSLAEPGSFASFRDDRGSGRFQGQRQSLVWMAPLTGVEGVAGMSNLRLALRDGTQLVLQLLAYNAVEEELQWPSLGQSQLLLDEVEEFALAYRPSPAADWQPEFDMLENGDLPYSIRLQIKVAGRYWPDLVVAPDQYAGGN